MNTRREFFPTALGLLAAAQAEAAAEKPKQILLIRHAEKTGDKADPHLNARGYARAAALIRLFPGSFDTPEVLFATHRSAHSNRPVETLTPLSRALHLNIDDRFGEDDYAPLAKQLLSSSGYAGKTLLVCWHHGRIPALAAALGVIHAPSPWPDAQFDRVWRIEYRDGVIHFTDLPQHLLEGDS